MNTLLLLLLIGLAGGLGSIARVLLSGWIAARRSAEVGIWVVNLTGSLAIGLAFGVWTGTGAAVDDWRLLLVTMGFLGGFTTVSTFALQVFDLAEKGEIAQARLLAFGSVLSCPLLALAGFGIGTVMGAR